MNKKAPEMAPQLTQSTSFKLAKILIHAYSKANSLGEMWTSSCQTSMVVIRFR